MQVRAFGFMFAFLGDCGVQVCAQLLIKQHDKNKCGGFDDYDPVRMRVRIAYIIDSLANLASVLSSL